MHLLSVTLPFPYVPAPVSRRALVAVKLLSTAVPLCPSHCLCGTILVTMCLMVWDWRVLRAEPILSCLLFCMLFHFVSYYFIFFSFYGLAVWGWDPRIFLSEDPLGVFLGVFGLIFNIDNIINKLL